MDYRQRAFLNQDKSIRIKHMAFAVKSVDEALVNYQSLLSVSEKPKKSFGRKQKQKLQYFTLMTLSFNSVSL